MPQVLVALVALVVVFASSSARAAPCDGFTDVEDTSPFCVNVAWMKNRGITLGCSATLYCPNDFVTRLQMAAFMYRLGFQNAFLRGGNAFGTAAVLGTTDAQPVEVIANGARAMRYEPSAVSPNVIGGSPANSVTAGVRGATIAGGGVPAGDTDPDLGGEAPNRVTDAYGTVGGGYRNRAGDDAGTTTDNPFATVGGGYRNTASGFAGTIGGGDGNTASDDWSTVGGGANNTASGAWSAAGGGTGNVASGDLSVVGGGFNNTASGSRSTVGGGEGNTASGSYSWAGGQNAKTQTADTTPEVHHGAFVWAGGGSFDFHSSAWNEFAVRATGGVRFVTQIDGTGNATRHATINPNGEIGFGAAPRQMLNLWATSYGIGIQANVMYHRIDDGLGAGGFYWYRGGVHDDATASPGAGGQGLMVLDRAGNLFTLGTINPPSDANVKTDFQPVDPQDVLAKVAAMPIASWRYREDPTAQRHLGPTAQDFRAAFELGAGERTIATVDADGVALAAIQGLNAKVEALQRALAAKEEVIARRDAQIHELAAGLAKLERSLDALGVRLTVTREQ